MEKIHVLADRRWQLDETADYLVEADPQRLTQALVQLAANAVKYTGRSSTIALGCRDRRPDGAGRHPGAGVRHAAAVGPGLTERASPRRTSSGSSSGSAGPTPAGARRDPAWAWRSSLPSPKHTADGSACNQVYTGTVHLLHPHPRGNARRWPSVRRILIAEDEERISRFIHKGLRAAGWTPSVVADGITALDHAMSASST